MLQHAPFTLPLDRERLASALRKGQGRALLHARQFGCAEFADLLVESLLFKLAWDPLLDSHLAHECDAIDEGRGGGDHVPWLLEILEVSRCAERVLADVLPRLTDDSESFGDLLQRPTVALALAQRGNPEAADRLRACLRAHVDGLPALADDEIIELDGEAGLIRVAEYLGRLVQAGEYDPPPEAIRTWRYDQERGKGAARAALGAAATSSSDIAAFLRAWEKAVSEEQERERGLPPYDARIRPWQEPVEDLITQLNQVEDEDLAFIFLLWGRQAAEADLPRFADAVFACPEPWRLAVGLAAFERRPAPSLVERLLPLADHPDAAVRSAAIRTLAMNKSQAIRELALRRLREGRVADGEIGLLAETFDAGDEALIESALLPAPDPEAAHALARDILRVAERNATPSLAPALFFAYEETPCGLCREDIAKRLVERGAAPEWLLEECRADAMEEIRALADEIQGPKQ